MQALPIILALLQQIQEISSLSIPELEIRIRLSQSKFFFFIFPLKENNRKIYAQVPQFSCIATNSIENAFATGSEKGEIRLYKEVGQNAKTLFPGLGDPIIGLDSTMDAQWLLATTKTYIMLIQTIIDGKSGYKQSISKDRRTPFKLTILPQDMKRYRIRELNFQPAKFNDNENTSERFIIASTGEFLVTWSLKHVLRGHVDRYEVFLFLLRERLIVVD